MKGLAILAEDQIDARPTRRAFENRQGLAGGEESRVARTMPRVAAAAIPTPKREELDSPMPLAPFPDLPDVVPPLPDCPPAGGADWLERANTGVANRIAAAATDKTTERIKSPSGGLGP